MKRSLVGVRSIFSILGGLVGLLGLSVASQKMAQAARTLRPPPSIYWWGPRPREKRHCVEYLCHTPRPDELCQHSSAATDRQTRR